MSRLLSTRGSVYVADVDTGGGKFELDPPLGQMRNPGTGDLFTVPIITDVVINDKDIVAKVACLDDVRVIYSFGKDFGSVAVVGECLLGPTCNKLKSDKTVMDYFETNRVSVLEEPIKLSISGARAYEFYLTGVQFQNYDPQFNVLPFVLSGVMINSNAL